MRGRGTANSDEFIREVDDAVREDRWLKLWRQYGGWAIGAVLAVVIGSAAGIGWRNYEASQRADEARRYAAAEELLQQDRAADAAAAFAALAEDADSGFAILARLRAAEALGRAGDAAGRSAAIGELAGDDGASPIYRELGELLAAQEDLASEDPAVLAARMDGVAQPDQPWRYSAVELKALALIRGGDTVEARRTLSALLGDPGTPPHLGRRAAELLASLGGPLPSEEAADSNSEDPQP